MKKFNKVVHSYFQIFCPSTQWYAGSYEPVFKISKTFTNHLSQ